MVTLDLAALDSLESKAREIMEVLKHLNSPPLLLLSSCPKVFGELDVLVNCGGVSVRGGAVETVLEVHKKVMDTNYFGIKDKCARPHGQFRDHGVD